MNFICYYLIEVGFEEEQIFWILNYLIEKLIPKNYFTNMLPLLADIKMIKYLLKEKNPAFLELLMKFKVDLNFLLIPWFLLIFTSIDNFELNHIIFDRFLVEGVVVYFKICLVVFRNVIPYIKKAVGMQQFVNIIKNYLRDITNV